MTADRNTPSCHDSVTTLCPACRRPFDPVGRQRWCSQACRAAGYRRRKQAATPPLVLPAPRPRRPHTVYECDSCGSRSLGAQRCDQCGAFMRRVGIGGNCPNCDEAVTVTDLVGPEMAAIG